MAALRIGILGAARIARSFAEGVRGSDKVAVAAVASRRQDKAEDFAREHQIARALGSYEALLDDPEIDAIYNPLPNSLHAEWSIRAAEAGKHVLCEKPLGATAQEVAAMFKAAQRAGVHLVEAYPYLSQPQTIALKAIAAKGEIGRLRHIQAGFGFPLNRPNDVRWEPALAGGALMDVGCYSVSLVRVLAGERPVRVSAAAEWTENGVDRALIATLEHASGLLAQVSCSFASADYRKAMIVGEAGVVETHFWNHTSADYPARLRIKRSAGQQPDFETLELAEANGFRAEAEAFAGLVAGDESAWTGASAQQSLDIAATLEAILASARAGRSVDVAAPN